MGRAGIKRRKRKKPLPRLDKAEVGIIEDLQDQAAWSSYGAHIPRGGNDHRNGIWWNRGFRFYHGPGLKKDNRNLRSPYFWAAARVGIWLMLGFFAISVILTLAEVVKLFF